MDTKDINLLKSFDENANDLFEHWLVKMKQLRVETSVFCREENRQVCYIMPRLKSRAVDVQPRMV